MPKPRVLKPEDYAAMLRRRWYLIVFPAVAGLAVGFALVRILPKRYTSRTLMLVERQQVPHSFVEPVISEDLNARIANIEEQTLSRTRLQPIIERYQLFKNEQPGKSMDELVLMLQKDVALTPVRPIVQTQDQTIPGFYLAVTLDDPRTAQQVSSDLASMFIDEDIHQRQRSAEGTTSFLQGQLDDAKRNLDQQEGVLANFERKYMGMLPDETTTNLTMLSTLNGQLQIATQAVDRAVQDKAYAESVLAQQIQAWKLTAELKEGFTPAGTRDPDLDQLQKLQTLLASLKGSYSDKYPDVIKTKASIQELEARIKTRAASAAPKGPSKAPVAELNEPAEIGKLRGQVRADEEAIRLGIRQQQELKNTIQQYESRLQLSPAIEEQYKNITRDHDMALKFYNSLLAKRDQSAMASDLQRRQEGEQLSVMDSANLPDEPSFPKPAVFIGGGFAGGLALGLAAVFGIETNDKRIRSTRDIEFYLGVQPFALIPRVEMTALSGARRQPAVESAVTGPPGA